MKSSHLHNYYNTEFLCSAYKATFGLRLKTSEKFLTKDGIFKLVNSTTETLKISVNYLSIEKGLCCFGDTLIKWNKLCCYRVATDFSP